VDGSQLPLNWTPNPAMAGLPSWHTVRDGPRLAVTTLEIGQGELAVMRTS
jgi:hypothetical protein